MSLFDEESPKSVTEDGYLFLTRDELDQYRERKRFARDGKNYPAIPKEYDYAPGRHHPKLIAVKELDEPDPYEWEPFTKEDPLLTPNCTGLDAGDQDLLIQEFDHAKARRRQDIFHRELDGLLDGMADLWGEYRKALAALGGDHADVEGCEQEALSLARAWDDALRGLLGACDDHESGGRDLTEDQLRKILDGYGIDATGWMLCDYEDQYPPLFSGGVFLGPTETLVRCGVEDARTRRNRASGTNPQGAGLNSRTIPHS